MSRSISPLKKMRSSSRYALLASAFDKVNYQTPDYTSGIPTNLTITSDTPKGVLAGQVAVIDTGADWQCTFGTHQTALGKVLGLFATNSEGAAYENSPVTASGYIGIYMDGGEFEVYIFETNSCVAADSDASILASYTRGAALYISPFGFLTCQKPSTLGSPYNSGQVDNVVGYVTRTPTSSSLILGVRLAVKN